MSTFKPLNIIAIALLAASLAAGSLRAEDTSGEALPKDRAGFDAMIRDYIMQHPEMLREALLKLEQDEQVENTKRILRGYKNELYASGSPQIGAKDGKVKIVEFYDYNCQYCRASFPKVRAFLKANPDVTLVMKDVASFGPDSEAVARIALAANQQGKFEPLNDALLALKGKATEARALEIAAKLGLDVAKLKKDAQSADIAEEMKRAKSLADSLNANITPLFVIGHNGISGAPEDLEAQLGEAVGQIRKSGCDVC